MGTNFEQSKWEGIIDFRDDIMIDEMTVPTIYRTYSGSVSSLRDCFHENLRPHHFSQWHRDAGWREFCDLRQQQLAWTQEQTSIGFKDYFAMLPNVTEANFMPSTDQYLQSNKSPAWKKLRERMLVGPSDWMDEPLDSSVNGHELSGVACLSFLEAIGSRASLPGVKQITKLDVWSLHDGPLQDLMNSDDGTELTYIQRGWDTRYQKLQEGFRPLTELTFNVHHEYYVKEDLSQQKVVELMGLLHAAKRLKKAHVVYTNKDEFDMHLDPFESSLARAPPSWPAIEHLTMSTHNMTHPHFVNMLRCYAPTLRSIKLDTMMVGDLEPFIAELPRVLKKLETVHLQGIYYRCPHCKRLHCQFGREYGFGTLEGWAVKAYILGKQTALPDLAPRKACREWRFANPIRDDDSDSD